MVNILLEGYDIQAPWLYDELKNYINPNHRVAVVAFSFRDSRVKSLSDWNVLYSKDNGKFYGGIVGGFATYGISENNISFINYFVDTKESAKKKIEDADIIYSLGGLPDRMMDRIKEFDLQEVLMNHARLLWVTAQVRSFSFPNTICRPMMITPNSSIMRDYHI